MAETRHFWRVAKKGEKGSIKASKVKDYVIELATDSLKTKAVKRRPTN